MEGRSVYTTQEAQMSRKQSKGARSQKRDVSAFLSFLAVPLL